MTRKLLYTISIVIYIVLMAVITAPPITRALDKVSPRILGMPFLQFFLFAIPITMAVWLIIWFLWECKIEDAEKNMENGGDAK